MTFRDFLFAMNTYPNRTPHASVTDAIAVAAAFDARLAAVACEVKIQVPFSWAGNALLNIPGMVATEQKKSENHVAVLLAELESEASKHGVTYESIRELCFAPDVPDLLVDYARLRDMTILPFPGADYLDQWFAESLLFRSGRPMILLPQPWERRSPAVFDNVVIAWDFSRSAVRAVGDALPALQKARNVYVVTVNNEKEIDSKRSASEMAKHLAHHSVPVIVDQADAAGRDIGTAIKAYCVSRDADLLVMGAYGHSRLLEFVLGGATKSLLSNPTLPVLMSH